MKTLIIGLSLSLTLISMTSFATSIYFPKTKLDFTSIDVTYIVNECINNNTSLEDIKQCVIKDTVKYIKSK